MNSPSAIRRRQISQGNSPWSWRLLGAAVLTACLGCWQEVPYTPAPRTASSSPGSSQQDTPTASDVSPPPATSGADPSAGELFSSDPVLPPVSPPIETTPIETAPIESTPIEATPPVVATTDPVPAATAPAVTPAMRRDAWTAASDWSLAAAMYAKGMGADLYQQYLDSAASAAAAVGVELPALPIAEEGGNIQSTVAAALVGDLGTKFAASIGKHVDDAAGAAAELAIQAHVILLTYSPLGGDVRNAATAIRTAGVRSRLPKNIWQPALDVISRRPEWAEVRKAVFTMRDAIAAHLAEKATPSTGG